MTQLETTSITISQNCVTIIIVLHKQQTHQGQVFFAHGPDIQNKSNQEQWEIFHPMAEKKTN